MIVDIIIPAYNEADSITAVIKAIPTELVRRILVCNNASTDATAKNALLAGAEVVDAPLRGYGNACLAGIAAIKSNPPDVVVFLDGDYSDYPEALSDLLKPIQNTDVQLVIGSRVLKAEVGALTPQQRFGNALATSLLRLIYGVRYTDLGPFRAIRYEALLQLNMIDQNYGWTIEMQIKAARKKMRFAEVSVRYRHRLAGQSKVSGTLSGSAKAGYKILLLIARYAFK